MTTPFGKSKVSAIQEVRPELALLFISLSSVEMKAYSLFPRTPGLFSSLNVQKNMLQDELRAKKFKQAVNLSIRGGDVVIDLGTGTGILAIWAAQAGAKKVYAIEETDVAGVAEAVVQANGFKDVIQVIRANSSQVTLPEPADVLIAELVGHFLFEEGIVESISEVREALLKPDGRIIPSAAEVYIAPVELNPEFNEISFWDTWKDPDLSSIRKRAANSAYVETVEENKLLATPVKIFSVEFKTVRPRSWQANVNFLLTKKGRFDALAGWFKLQLCNGLDIDTGPGSEPTHWQQCVFPLEYPFNVEAGLTLSFAMDISPFMPGSKWKWEIVSQTGAVRRESHEFNITYSQDPRLLKERF